MKRLIHIATAVALVLLTGNLKAQNIITTVAGSPMIGGYFGDGDLATLANLGSPTDVTVDASGNIYIADFLNNVIRKVDPVTGIITTYAGTGFGAGSTAAAGAYTGDNGPATAADLNGPYAITIDRTGNIFFCDGYNHAVRKVSAAGIITTVAGQNAAGFSGDGGPATAAKLNNPVGIAVDTFGNIFIADDHNNVIRKVNAAGIISTYSGDSTVGHAGNGGPATDALLSNPLGVALDKAGNLYIADADNNVIRKVTTAGIISDYVGFDTVHGYSGDGGPATAAKLNYPIHLRCDDSDNLYIADARNHVVRKVTPAGIISTFAGDGTGAGGAGAFDGDGGSPTSAKMNLPHGMGMGPGGVIYIADRGNSVIRKVGPRDLTGVQQVAGLQAGLSVFPNPARGNNVNVKIASDKAEDARVVITNVVGMQVKELTLTTNKTANIGVALVPGLYFISANTAHGLWHTQLVVSE